MPLFGVLPIDKRAGISSRVVVNRIERLVRSERVGHTGTLDPMATGVLLMAIGSATKLVEFSHELAKGYEATFELGKSSDTLDATGEVKEADIAVQPSAEAIQTELSKWQGRVQQVPPNFSALVIDGRRAYKMARKGVEFDLAPREVEINRLELVDYQFPFFKLNIECGSGTYVRAIGRDIAQGLGTHAIMTALTRTRVGPFTLDDCVDARGLYNRYEVQQHLHPPQRLVHNWYTVTLNEEQTIDLRNGQTLRLNEQIGRHRFVVVDSAQNLVGLMEATQEAGVFRSLRVFHADNAANQPKKIKTKQSPES